MDLNAWTGIIYIILTISGGVITRMKGDYLSRGMGIAFLTGIFGVLVLVFSRRSGARKNYEYDLHDWPHSAYLAVFAQLLLVLVLLLRYWFS